MKKLESRNSNGRTEPDKALVVQIRREWEIDVDVVRAINQQAFGGAVEARLVDALRGTPGALSLVAIRDEQPVGHILFTPVALNPPTAFRVAALGPMSVRPDRQRQGIGSRLVEAGLEECRELGYAAAVVVGHPEFYPRFGFAPARPRGLQSEFSVPDDVFMVMELVAGALDGVRAIVRYRPEFSEA